MATWRDGLDESNAWAALVGDVTVEEFLGMAGTDDVREACRAHSARLSEMYPEEIGSMTAEDIDWATTVLVAYAEKEGGR